MVRTLPRGCHRHLKNDCSPLVADLGEGGDQAKRPGRGLSYVAKVQFNGNLLVGKAYTAQLGLQPGDEFQIKLGKKQIRLIPAGTGDDEE